VNVELGKIVGVWGVKGWVKLHSYTRNRADISQYKTWLLQSPRTRNNDNLQPQMLKTVEVLNCRQQGPGIVAQFEGINNRDQAMALNSYRILVNQADLPALPNGEYYWQQLIGLSVSNEQQPIGTVDSILETGANDVLVCKSTKAGRADVLIPYTEHVVKDVDLAQGTMLVDWDPAYLED